MSYIFMNNTGLSGSCGCACLASRGLPWCVWGRHSINVCPVCSICCPPATSSWRQDGLLPDSSLPRPSHLSPGMIHTVWLTRPFHPGFVIYRLFSRTSSSSSARSHSNSVAKKNKEPIHHPSPIRNSSRLENAFSFSFPFFVAVL